MAVTISSTRGRSSLYPELPVLPSAGEILSDLTALIDNVPGDVLRNAVALTNGDNPEVNFFMRARVSTFLNSLSDLTGNRRFSQYVDPEWYTKTAIAWGKKEDDKGPYYTATNEDGSVHADVYVSEGEFYWVCYYDGQSGGFADGKAGSLKDAQQSAAEVMSGSSSPFSEEKSTESPVK